MVVGKVTLSSRKGEKARGRVVSSTSCTTPWNSFPLLVLAVGNRIRKRAAACFIEEMGSGSQKTDLCRGVGRSGAGAI